MRFRRIYGVLGVEFGKAPVVWPATPGTHGLMTPVLSVGPVPIAALLAPVAVMPPPLLVSAIEFVDCASLDDEWSMSAFVLLHAGLEF